MHLLNTLVISTRNLSPQQARLDYDDFTFRARSIDHLHGSWRVLHMGRYRFVGVYHRYRKVSLHAILVSRFRVDCQPELNQVVYLQDVSDRLPDIPVRTDTERILEADTKRVHQAHID